MKKSTLLWASIIVLFLLNAGTLLFMSRPHHQGPPNDRDGNQKFDEMVISSLQLTPEQVHQFDQMKRQHHEQMLHLDEATKRPFDSYFSLLTEPKADTIAKDSLERMITDLYRQRIEITYRHFNELKSICTPEQQQKFTLLIPSLMQVMSTGEKNNEHHRRKMN